MSALPKVRGKYDPTTDHIDITLVNEAVDVSELKEILIGIIDKSNSNPIKKTKLFRQIESCNSIGKLQQLFYNQHLAGEGYSTDGYTTGGRKTWNRE